MPGGPRQCTSIPQVNHVNRGNIPKQHRENPQRNGFRDVVLFPWKGFASPFGYDIPTFQADRVCVHVFRQRIGTR